ncbi:MAG TPA: SDR family oxidoreductase [Burkholderiaceae bacterium]|nr:SDR family oxidoreductase [Burkholderiaceae bacterium]
MAERLLIIGATSAIANALARRFAARGARLFLVARSEALLADHAADLRVRGAADVQAAVLDANDTPRHDGVLGTAFVAFDGFDAALVAHGTLPDQAACEASTDAALAEFDTNARSTIALLTALASRFEAQRAGVLAVISSPAGERGRASNYVYGAAKAAVTAFASGLRQRLVRHGVRVLTIVPGFVDTPMTAAFQKGALWATPERVAADIDRALAGGFGTVYTPWFWRWIMLIIRSLPERVFVKLKL